MNKINKDKRYVLNEHLRNISHISDEAYQRRVWIRGEGPECNDFDETVCHFFDVGNLILEHYKDYGITDSQYQMLMKFRNEFEAFSDENHFPPEFIASPEWKKIMEMAQEIVKAFNYQKNGKST
jgi:hypothetical protein